MTTKHATQKSAKGRAGLCAALIGFGLYSLGAQILSLREFLVIFFGNELCLGVILASWFAGISAGAFAALGVLRKFKNDLAVFTLSCLSLGLILPLQIGVIRQLRGLLQVQPGMNIPLLPLMLSALFIMLPVCFMVGFAFPFACRFTWRRAQSAAASVGFVYALEAAGSLAGGLLLTFFFIGRLPVYSTVAWLNILMGCLCLPLLLGEKKRFLALGAALFVSLTALCLAAGLAGAAEDWTIEARWRGLNAAMTLDESIDTPYQNIAVSHLAEQYSVFGNGQLAASFPNRYMTEPLGHLIMCRHPAPEQVLLIGDCSLELLAPLLAHGPARLDYVELDPGMFAVQKKYQDPEIRRLLDRPPVRHDLLDGRLFVKKTDQLYDVIIINVPDPSTAMLNRFYTTDFFRELRARLRENGLVFFKIRSAVNYFSEEVGHYAASLYHSLKSVFKNVVVTPGEENYFFASDGPGRGPLDLSLLAERYEQRGITSPYFTAGQFYRLFPPMAVDYTMESFEDRFVTPLNTDKHPLTYFFNLLLWDRFSGGRAADFFLGLYRLNRWWFFIPPLLILLFQARHLLRRKAGRLGEQTGGRILFAITTTGFSAMAFEIVLIFLYQNLFGYLYRKIGLIVSLFMFGLFLGALLSPRLFEKRKRAFSLLMGCEAALLLLALLLSPLADGVLTLSRVFPAAAEPVFLLLLTLVGVLAGSEFPLAAGLYRADRGHVDRASAVIDSTDHLGACAGALVTGVILMPLLGVFYTGLFIALLKTASIVGLAQK